MLDILYITFAHPPIDFRSPLDYLYLNDIYRNFMEFFPPNIFDECSVESRDMEHKDMEDQV